MAEIHRNNFHINKYDLFINLVVKYVELSQVVNRGLMVTMRGKLSERSSLLLKDTKILRRTDVDYRS